MIRRPLRVLRIFLARLNDETAVGARRILRCVQLFFVVAVREVVGPIVRIRRSVCIEFVVEHEFIARMCILNVAVVGGLCRSA